MVQDIYVPLLNLKVRVIRKHNRRMYLRVRPPEAEVEVTAPWVVGDEAIVAFVEDHAAWLIKARQKVLHAAVLQSAPTDTGRVTYMGEAHRLSWEHGSPRTEVIRTPGRYWSSWMRVGKTPDGRNCPACSKPGQVASWPRWRRSACPDSPRRWA